MNVKDMYNLNGKTAIVTGGASGLGLQMAKGLCEAGADVVLADIKKQYFRSISKVKQNSSSFKVDVGNVNQVESLVKFVIKRYGKIDILVNNAGIAAVQDTKKVTYQE